MLVLTRKQNEEIQIGHDIVIKVISTGRGKVKIGIEAPSSVKVLRAELDEEVKAARLDSAATPSGTLQNRVKAVMKAQTLKAEAVA
jgi:carbon storage regulator